MHPSPDVLALLALGERAGTESERDHVLTCSECQAEVEGLTRVVGIGRRTSDADGLLVPSEHVWQSIRAELQFDVPRGAHGLSEVASVTALPRHALHEEPPPDAPQQPAGPARTRAPRRFRVAALALAAAVALVAGIGLGLGLDRIVGPRQTILWTAELQALPDWAGSSGAASVVENAEGERTLIIDIETPDPRDGSDQVWLIDSAITEMTALGYLVDGEGRFPIPRTVDPRQFPVVDVSEEPAVDPDVRHSGNSIVRGTLNV